MKIKIRSKVDDYIEKLYEEQGIKVTKAWLSRKAFADTSQLYRWSKNKEDGFVENAPNVGYAILLAQSLKCNVEDLFEVVVVEDDEIDTFFTDET